jgi:hypothetical protein
MTSPSDVPANGVRLISLARGRESMDAAALTRIGRGSRTLVKDGRRCVTLLALVHEGV